MKSFFYLTNNASPTLSHLLRPLFLPFPSVPSPPSLPPSFFNLTPFPRMEFETEKDIFKKYRILFSLNKLRRDINFTGGRPRWTDLFPFFFQLPDRDDLITGPPMGFVPSLFKMQLFGGKRLHFFLSESRVSYSWDLYCLFPSFPSC